MSLAFFLKISCYRSLAHHFCPFRSLDYIIQRILHTQPLLPNTGLPTGPSLLASLWRRQAVHTRYRAIPGGVHVRPPTTIPRSFKSASVLSYPPKHIYYRQERHRRSLGRCASGLVDQRGAVVSHRMRLLVHPDPAPVLFPLFTIPIPIPLLCPFLRSAALVHSAAVHWHHHPISNTLVLYDHSPSQVYR